MKPRMDNQTKIGLILLAVVAVAIASGIWATMFEPSAPPFEPRPRPPFENQVEQDLELFYIVKTVISSVNVALLVVLLALYVGIYQKTHSEFTVGLIVFSVVLLLYAFASIPIVHVVFGYRAFGLGPFAMLPDLFSLAALCVLLYLTIRY